MDIGDRSVTVEANYSFRGSIDKIFTRKNFFPGVGEMHGPILRISNLPDCPQEQGIFHGH